MRTRIIINLRINNNENDSHCQAQHSYGSHIFYLCNIIATQNKYLNMLKTLYPNY